MTRRARRWALSRAKAPVGREGAALDAAMPRDDDVILSPNSGSGFATVATKLFAKRTTLRFGAYRDECIRSLRRKFSLSCSRNACSSGSSANASNVLPRGHDLESIVVDPVQVPAVGQEVFLHGEHFLDPAVEWAGFDDL